MQFNHNLLNSNITNIILPNFFDRWGVVFRFMEFLKIFFERNTVTRTPLYFILITTHLFPLSPLFSPYSPSSHSHLISTLLLLISLPYLSPHLLHPTFPISLYNHIPLTFHLLNFHLFSLYSISLPTLSI